MVKNKNKKDDDLGSILLRKICQRVNDIAHAYI